MMTTNTLATVDGTPCRLWEGKTESGIPVFAYIAQIAVHKSENQLEFRRELQDTVELSATAKCLPFRLNRE